MINVCPSFKSVSYIILCQLVICNILYYSDTIILLAITFRGHSLNKVNHKEASALHHILSHAS